MTSCGFSNDDFVWLQHTHTHITNRHHSAEWYRCTSLWAHDEAAPKSGYIWRMRNKKGDRRVQTDILGGAGVECVCVCVCGCFLLLQRCVGCVGVGFC